MNGKSNFLREVSIGLSVLSLILQNLRYLMSFKLMIYLPIADDYGGIK